jgi:S-adenosylmethionine:tRNA ribosyltransferase-isomerase
VNLPGKIDISEFAYALPDFRIAKYPLERRDKSKLLIYKEGLICQDFFNNLDNHLPFPSDLYLNNTRVIHARLIFRRPTGAFIEIFCLTPVDPMDYQRSFASENSCTWKCMVGNLKKWKDDSLQQSSVIKTQRIELIAEKVEVNTDSVLVRFTWNGKISFGEIMDELGKIPIPPYLNRDAEQVDNDRYQTIYSRPDGSVAAPTAGLHFTPEVFRSLEQKNIETHEITLHVGAGTFKPVKSENALDHSMHKEYFSIPMPVIENFARSDNPVIAVGTTTLRTLESLFWLAVKSVKQHSIARKLDQWEYTEFNTNIPKKEIFRQFYELLRAGESKEFSAETGIMIIPGYEFKIVNKLITNFHQPCSTLLLLVSAFIGEAWKDVYAYALENDFRFLSYGDSSLLSR